MEKYTKMFQFITFHTKFWSFQYHFVLYSIDESIKVYDRIRYLVLFFGGFFDKALYFIGGLTNSYNYNFERTRIYSDNYLLTEKYIHFS